MRHGEGNCMAGSWHRDVAKRLVLWQRLNKQAVGCVISQNINVEETVA